MQHVIPELDRHGLRKFAFTTGGIVAILFGILLPWLFDFDFPRWPWIVLLVLAAWGAILPASLKPVYYWWMRFGLLLNKITTPIVMGVVFFLVLVPTAMFMRYVLRRDPMKRSFEPNLESYRIHSPQSDPDNLTRPF